MEIRGYLKTSAIEWPGKISSVIFVSGCNFRCSFCYNRDSVLNPQKLPKFSEKEILRDLEKRKKWVDGVVVTGGEPTLQPDLDKFLEKVKKLGFLTMIETNGSIPEVMAKLLNGQMVDYIAMDIKGPLDGRYAQITNFYPPAGGPISNIKKSINLIINSGIDSEFRTTVVPGIHDKKTLVLMAKQIEELIKKLKNRKTKKLKWFLQEFQPKTCLDPKFTKIKPYSEPEMRQFLVVVKKIIPQTYLR